MATQRVNGDLFVVRRAQAGIAQNFPAWQEAQAYLEGDYAEEAGVLYRCIVDHTSAVPFASDLGSGFWAPLGAGGGGSPGKYVEYTAASPWVNDPLTGEQVLTITDAEHELGDIGGVTAFNDQGQVILTSIKITGDLVEIRELSSRAGKVFITAADAATTASV